jgi:hypothetical protein
MKKTTQRLLLVCALAIILTGCSVRIADYSIISTRNHQFHAPKDHGISIKGESMNIIGFGTSIQDAIDDALRRAGMGYDVLLDVVVKVEQKFLFYQGYTVEGLAIQSAKIIAKQGPQGFSQWLLEQEQNGEVYSIVK